MKTMINFYYYNTANGQEAQDYALLCESLKEDKGRAGLFACICSKPHALGPHGTSQPIELNDDIILRNQWDSDFGRVFDWYEDIRPYDRSIKRGHYLDITQEMIDVRNNTYVCGYCGRYSDKADIFCRKCLGSEYLTEGNLDLLALRPVAISNSAPRLPDGMQMRLKKLWRVAQVTRLKEKAKKLIADTRKEKARYVAEANEKLRIKLHFLNNGVDIGNMIYYPSRNVVCYGWRTRVSMEEAVKIESKLKPFWFTLEFNLNDGTVYTSKV